MRDTNRTEAASPFTRAQLVALETRFTLRDGEEAHLIVLLARALLGEIRAQDGRIRPATEAARRV